MNLSQFEDNLDRFGADMSAWPAALRAPAADLAATDPAARAALRTMQEIEAVFAVPPPAAAETSPASALAARAMRHRQIQPVRPAIRRAAWASAAAAALVLGVFIGDLAPRQRDESPSTVFAAAFDMPSDDNVE